MIDFTTLLVVFGMGLLIGVIISSEKRPRNDDKDKFYKIIDTLKPKVVFMKRANLSFYHNEEKIDFETSCISCRFKVIDNLEKRGIVIIDRMGD
jgi:hypothetical protein